MRIVEGYRGSWYSLAVSLITGLLFGAVGSLVTVSPLGRRSGAHLNPAATLAFWTRRHVHSHDLAGYTVSQVIGALIGTEIARLVWGSTARAVSLGVTQPGRGLDAGQAALVEALMTAILIGTILAMVSSERTARWTPGPLDGVPAAGGWLVRLGPGQTRPLPGCVPALGSVWGRRRLKRGFGDAGPTSPAEQVPRLATV